MTDVVKVTIDDRELEVPKGMGLVETAEAAGIEIPVFCYEPRLGPPVGACRMCLVEVEGLPKLQAGCTLVAQDGMVVRTAATSERAASGQRGTLEFILVNHPLDCPVCDKGGECPLQDLTFRYGPGLDADDVPEDDLRQADPGLAADRTRPRALHPLLPLHALLERRRRGRPADRPQPRRALGDHDVLGGPVPRALLGERDRALPGRRADLDAVPLRGAALGDPGRADRLRPLPRRLQHPRDDARGRGQARAVAEPPGGRRRLALRQGSLRVPAPPRRGSDPRAARARPAGARAHRLGRRARPCRGAPPRRRRQRRHRALRLGDDRDRVRPRHAAAPGRGRALGRPRRVDLHGPRRLPGAARDDRRRRARGRRRRRPGRRPRARRRPLAAQGAPGRRGDRLDRRPRRHACAAGSGRRRARRARRLPERARPSGCAHPSGRC